MAKSPRFTVDAKSSNRIRSMQELKPISIKALFEVGTFDAHMQAESLRSKVSHLLVFAFAPMPLNMQLGVVIGNKSEAITCQWERTHEN